MSAKAKSSGGEKRVDWKRVLAILAGIGLFAVVYLSPAWPDAVDPMSKHFLLSPQAKGALAVFLLAGIVVVAVVAAVAVEDPAAPLPRRRSIST